MPQTTVVLKLYKSLIYEAVKTDTFITGKIETQVDGSTNAQVFNKQTGDDQYHERKLERTLRGAVGAFESLLVEFVDADGGSITDTLGSNPEDEFQINIITSTRFNTGLASPMASLAQEFIINRMIAQWWTAAEPNLAQYYSALATDNISSVRRCLTKTAPAKSNAEFLDVTGSTI